MGVVVVVVWGGAWCEEGSESEGGEEEYGGVEAQSQKIALRAR